MTRAFMRSLWGGVSENLASRFLREIPGEYIEEAAWEDKQAGELGIASGELELLLGDMVVHAKWGPGKVIAMVELESDCEVSVEFPELGCKKLLLSFAPLSKPDAESCD